MSAVMTAPSPPPSPAPPPHASTLTSDAPLRVLNADLAARLSAATAAQRALTALGYRVIHQDLRLGSTARPLLTVRGDERLRARLTSLVRLIHQGTPTTVGRFAANADHAVDVALKEVGGMSAPVADLAHPPA